MLIEIIKKIYLFYILILSNIIENAIQNVNIKTVDSVDISVYK